MADTNCVTSPTLTTIVVATSHSAAVVTTTSVEVVPATTSFSLVTSCTNTTLCTTTTSVIRQPATTITNVYAITSDIDVPFTATTTLYGSSCRVTSNKDDSSTSSSTGTLTTLTTPTTTTSLTTYATSSLVTSDGQTFTTYYTTTSTSLLSAPTSNNSSSGTQNNTGAIIGGTIGGVAALALLALLTWHMIKKSRRFDDLFSDNNANPYGAPKNGAASNQYQYGPVGQQDTAIGFSPPNSPVQHANLANEMGMLNTGAAGIDPGGLQAATSGNAISVGSSANTTGIPTSNDVMYNAPNQASIHHLRNPSAVPLLVGVAGAGAGAGAANQLRPNTASSGRVSVASSDPIGPLVAHAPPPQNIGYPQQYASYPPALATYAQQQFYGPSQGQVQQNQNLGHNTSAGSSSALSSSSVQAGPSTMQAQRPNQFPQQQQHQQLQYVQAQQHLYEDPFGRTGNPASYHENQPLQMMNPGSSNPHAEEGSSSSSSRRFSTPGLTVIGSTSSTTLQVDGKGRPLNIRGEKAPLVHLDGGAYQQAPGQPRTPAPPAYME